MQKRGINSPAITTRDTYFISNVDKVNVGQTQHQWVFDTLAAAAANKQLEGDAFTAATLLTATRVSNYTQDRVH